MHPCNVHQDMTEQKIAQNRASLTMLARLAPRTHVPVQVITDHKTMLGVNSSACSVISLQ